MQYWDAPSVYTTASAKRDEDASSVLSTSSSRHQYTLLANQFHSFITEVTRTGSSTYRDQILRAYESRQFWMLLLGRDLYAYSKDLYKFVQSRPSAILPIFEEVLQKFVKRLVRAELGEHLGEDEDGINAFSIPEMQIVLKDDDLHPTPIRALSADVVGKLVKISGIVTMGSTTKAKATEVCLMCRGCRHTKYVKVESGFAAPTIPRSCERERHDANLIKDCPLDPYYIVHEKSTFIDQQTLRIQEAYDAIPMGEIPRSILCVAERYLCNRVTNGMQIEILGSLSVVSTGGPRDSGSVATRRPYLRVLGIRESRADEHPSAADESRYQEIARSGDVLGLLARSLAPSILGHTEVKKAIVCQLLGGVGKTLPDGMRLRGDMHVLLLGDPGVAKSQLLKFVQQVAPVGVYTSGKGSSAAGLTAAVIREPATREFSLEAGAMLLADGGVVCIDEFDKMRDEDRVAIHEAMEQQTISIAKAGITTILNSRVSVLAAANPRPGRFDDQQTAEDNIDFQSTILSRFDMIFLLKDVHDEKKDRELASHVIEVQVNDRGPGGQENLATSMQQDGAGQNEELPTEVMKGFIDYCRRTCTPVLSDATVQKLNNFYVQVRKEVKKMEVEEETKSVIPITLRQLEAIIRTSEAMAKMELSPVVEERHCQQAIRLFKRSTMDAFQAGHASAPQARDTRKARHLILERLPIGSTTSTESLRRTVQNKGMDSLVSNRAIQLLVNQGILQYRNGQRSVYRAARG